MKVACFISVQRIKSRSLILYIVLPHPIFSLSLPLSLFLHNLLIMTQQMDGRFGLEMHCFVTLSICGMQCHDSFLVNCGSQEWFFFVVFFTEQIRREVVYK